MTVEFKKRRAFEPGHARKFLLVVDDSAEVEQALYYAAARVVRSSGMMAFLSLVEPEPLTASNLDRPEGGSTG